ncbi:30S ribosomal protein S20 [Candidatus Woesebacteria bacterium]|nr:30S ribosomal protein S20 [Candidatus Woesebacteria bacterium]
MPVTKTAKRALRGSKKKAVVNKLVASHLAAAVRLAKKNPTKDKIVAAISLADRAAKTNLIHKNKANRIKRALGKILPKSKR